MNAARASGMMEKSIMDHTVHPGESIQAALDAATTGDRILVEPGDYREHLETRAVGVTLRSTVRRAAVILPPPGDLPGHNTIEIKHPETVFEGFVVDNEYSKNRAIDLTSFGAGGVFTPANETIIQDCELKRAARDLLDVGKTDGVLVEGCEIHHGLNWDPSQIDPRRDVHGITGGEGRLTNLLVRNCSIHTVSGDALQFDPDRSRFGYDNLVFERCTLWNHPMDADDPEGLNGFPADAMPGENALDTKGGGRQSDGLPHGRIFFRDCVASGWRQGSVVIVDTNGRPSIGLVAAFNIKEWARVEFDRCTVYDSFVAFRIRGRSDGRGPSEAALRNVVIHHCAKAIRCENNVGDPRDYTKDGGYHHVPEPPILVHHVTIGADVETPIVVVAGDHGVLDVENLLVLGSLPAFPARFTGTVRLAVQESSFVDVSHDDYRLMPGSPAVDAGVLIAGVAEDRDGVGRPQGAAPDVGAYEYKADEIVCGDVTFVVAGVDADGQTLYRKRTP